MASSLIINGLQAKWTFGVSGKYLYLYTFLNNDTEGVWNKALISPKDRTLMFSSNSIHVVPVPNVKGITHSLEGDIAHIAVSCIVSLWCI